MPSLFRVGEVYDFVTYGNSQYEGMVTNINLFTKPLLMPLESLFEKVCKGEVKADIAWDKMVWNHTGNTYEVLEMELDQICTQQTVEAVTLPLYYNFDLALKTCQKLGNGKITSYETPHNLSNVDFYQLYGQNYKVCMIISDDMDHD